MISRASIFGLYVITDSRLVPGNQLPERVAAAIDGGARIVQYRDKGSDATRRRQEAQALAQLCRLRGVIFLVNDDVALAKAVAADGIHLGQSDESIADARAELGDDAVVGISCHDSLGLALRAERQGADYVAFGRFFPSQTKPQAPPAQLSVLRAARQALRIPIVAIGGVTPDNGAALLAAGADALAVIHGVFGMPDVKEAARAYADLFAPMPGGDAPDDPATERMASHHSRFDPSNPTTGG